MALLVGCAVLALSGAHRWASAAPDEPVQAPAGRIRTSPTVVGAALPQAYKLAQTFDAELPTATSRLFHPEGLAIAPNGTVAVAERGNHLVSLWYASGESIGRWGERGDGPGEFESPEDVAWSMGGAEPLLYVADTGNARVQLLDGRDGGFLAEWTDVGVPRGIATGPDGRVFVSDGEGDVVRVFDAEGRPIAVWGGADAGGGSLSDPLGLSVGPDNLVYVADHGNQRVVWFDADGAVAGFLSLDNTSSPGGAPNDAGVDDAGNLYVAVDRGVLRFRGRQTYVDTESPFWEKPRQGCLPGRCCVDLLPIEENHEGVRRLDVTAGGGLYFTYAPALRWKDRVTAIPSGWFPTHWPQCGVPEATHATDPMRIDAGRDPYIHVLDTSTSLHVYRPDGQLYNGMLGNPAGTGVDLAAGGIAAPIDNYRDSGRTYTAVITGNQVAFYGVHKDGCANCSYPRTCPPQPSIDVIEPVKVVDDLENVVHWNRALTFTECGLSVAALDASVPQIVVRPWITENLSGPVGAFATPMPNGVRVGDRRLPFAGYSDIEYGPDDTLFVLARAGIVATFDRHGRPGAAISLQGLGKRSAEAIAVESANALFVITGDGWVYKFDGMGTPLAAWSVAEQAGPGRYEDIAVDVLNRVVVPDGDNDRVLVFEQSATPPAETPPDHAAACDVTTDKTALPSRLPLGDTTNVSLRIAADCSQPRDIVVVVDGSCQMTGDRMVAAREGALRLVEALQPGRDRLALVSFTDAYGGARVLAGLTDDRTALADTAAHLPTECLPGWLAPGRGPEGRVSDGLRAGREALYLPVGREGAEKVLVLITASVFDVGVIGDRLIGAQGPQVTDREHALWEARQLWRAGARVVTIGVGQDGVAKRHEPDQGLLAAMSMPAWDYHYASPSGVPAVFAALASELADGPSFEHLEIVDRLPDNMRLVPGSARPPARIGADGSLRWDLSNVGAAERPELGYTLEPLDPGRWPTNLEAVAVYTDGLGAAGSTVFPVPYVDVIPPTGTYAPSPTASSTPTPTPTATNTARPTPTAPPTATATHPPTAAPPPPPEALYLPLVYRQRCKPTIVPIDVVLAIDTSSSMNGDKVNAAGAAARGFVALLELPRDHAAVVTFDSEARLTQALTGDRAALERALTGLETHVGTRIDEGLWAALDAVAGTDARPEADPVIVLLTDGRAQGGTEGQIDLALAIARELRVTIYTIGLGSDVDPDALRRIAGADDRVYIVPDADALSLIYDEIARVIPCR